eukprot:CCRYP_008922-RA/>CCRYP_008922-RA protein AED:0.11 eAED:0.11 QI:0/0/0/1/1/1/4/0/450
MTTEENAQRSKERITAKVHVERRHVWLNKAWRRIVFVATTLPLWMTVRMTVRMVGWVSNSLGRWLAHLIPVAVPGLSYGSEPLKVDETAAVDGEVAQDAPTVVGRDCQLRDRIGTPSFGISGHASLEWWVHCGRHFDIYGKVVKLSDALYRLFTVRWAPWRRNDTPSMYDSHTGIGLLNPMNVVPLYSMFHAMGVERRWERQEFYIKEERAELQYHYLRRPVRHGKVLPNGKKRIHDEFDNTLDVDRVVFACPANSVGSIYKQCGWLANTIFSTLVYADDHHPDSVIHSDGTVIDERFRDDCLKRASNYEEVTEKAGGSINIENQYNFGVQTPGPGVYDLPLDKKPVMLISHALRQGKSINPKLMVGTANHARAHPLYSGWNVMAMLSIRLVQGKNGISYCSNWTTPGNCHDMSFLSGLVCAHAIGAKYPFEKSGEAKKDFRRMRDLMEF